MGTPYKSIPLFKNPFLEKFTHVHPITPLIVWTPVVGYFVWRAFAVHHLGVLPMAGVALVALFTWTFFEYFLHRFVFHYSGKNKWGQRLVYFSHGVHHLDANDPTRLVMPPLFGALLAAMLYPLFHAVWGDPWVEPFFAFFLVGYLAYDYTHFATHHFKPLTRWGKFVKHYHMLHHFVSPDARWGVSNPLWDYVFRTTGSKSAAKKAHAQG